MRTILSALVLATASAAQSSEPPQAAAPAPPPNIVIFYVDDLGWRDTAFQGSAFYETPHLDALAAEGLVFTSAYSNGPNCAPSRASLLSGLWTSRHGVYTVGYSDRGRSEDRTLVPVKNRKDLDGGFVTFAEALRARGYATGHFGKWHLGDDPRDQGFDVNVGGSIWGQPPGGYVSPYQNPALPDPELPGENLTDRLTREAIAWVDTVGERPFLAYVSHYAVHAPIQEEPERTKRFAEKAPDGGQSNATYAAMIARVDESLGALRAALAERGLAENTLVWFTSDNGGVGGITSNAPLRGAKGMLYEGGVRVPMAVVGPGVRRGRCDTPVSGIDVYPTLLSLAGGPATGEQLPALDGASLAPLFASDVAERTAEWSERPLYWHFPAYLEGPGKGRKWRMTPAGSLRRGSLKLIEPFETGAVELYDLASDLGEEHDLARERPDEAEAMLAELRAWRERVDAPMPTARR